MSFEQPIGRAVLLQHLDQLPDVEAGADPPRLDEITEALQEICYLRIRAGATG